MNNTIEQIPEVLTPAEVAKVLRIGKSSMYKLVKQGDIASLRVGRKIIIPKQAISTYIERKICYDNNTTLEG